MKLKLLHISKTAINEYFFNDTDSMAIVNRLKSANKQWAAYLLGFFINATDDEPYAAITVRADDNSIENMEYRGIDIPTAEFAIDANLLAYLSACPTHTEIPLAQFESVFERILHAPTQARRWEIYPAINNLYAIH